MKDLREILEEIDWDNLWINADDIHKREILEDINDWLLDETEKQDFIEEYLRNDTEE